MAGADPFTLLVTPPARRSLDRLSESAAAAVVEFMLGDLLTSPYRVGEQLRGELTGLWSARRGAYRVVYDIDDDQRTVAVLCIDHRTDVYRPR